MSHVDEGTLHAYLDGELPAAERAQLEAHIAECAPCRERLTEERGLIERADRLLTLAELPAGHTHRPAPAPVQTLRRRPRFVVPVTWAASIALAFLTGWLLRPAAFRETGMYAARQIPAAVPPDSPTTAPARDTVRLLASRAPAEPRRAAEAKTQAQAPMDAASRGESVAVAQAALPIADIGTPKLAENSARPALRGAAPTPIPPTTVAVRPSAGAPAFSEAQPAAGQLQRRAIGTTWTVIAAEPARKVLGTDVARIPGIPVRDILENPLLPGQVMVEQEVAEGTIVQLLQSAHLDTAVLGYSSGGSPLQKTVGRLQVRISGPLTTDSLLRLLDRVR